MHEKNINPGTIMCNLFLADDINRTSPKTQSALLEGDGGGQSNGGWCEPKVPQPFVVIATTS